MSKRKVLLMGRQASGKSSMRGIIFADKRVSETLHLPPTMGQFKRVVLDFFLCLCTGYQTARMQILGDLSLNVWECGGQSSFLESYFESQKENIFRRVHGLIYVLDVAGGEFDKDLEYFGRCLTALVDGARGHARKPFVFCLLHKMDKLRKPESRVVFTPRYQQVGETLLRAFQHVEDGNFHWQIMTTSIWDDSLHRAWSAIVRGLISSAKTTQLLALLKKLRSSVAADEMGILDKSTWLLLASDSLEHGHDTIEAGARHDMFANTLKQFKISCARRDGGSTIDSLEVARGGGVAILERLTKHTYIFVHMNLSPTMSKPRIYPAAVRLNIDAARPHFARILGASA